MRNQKLEATGFARGGENKLVVEVTNTLINRISAMKVPPPVSPDLVSRFGSGTVSTETPREFGFKPLPASGLIGPIQIIPVKEVNIKY